MDVQSIEPVDTERAVGSFDAEPEPQFAPPEAPEPEARGRGVRWAVVVVSVILFVAVAVLLVLYVGAAGERDEAQDALADTEIALEDAEATITETEQALDGAEADLEEANAELATAEQAGTEANAELATAEQAGIEFLTVSFAIGGVEDEAAACLATTLYDARGPEILSDYAAAAIGSPDAMTPEQVELGLEMVQAAETCGVALEDLTTPGTVVAAPPSEADQQTADGSGIDSLYAECEAGSGEACDALFMLAEEFSMEEMFAMTCGGRFTLEDAPLFCEGNI